MGAQEFTDYGVGVDVAAAFREASSAAVAMYGNQGYTGSLAEKGDYVVVERTPLERAAAYALADRLMQANDPRVSDKWGPAGAIPVAADNCFKKRTVTMKVVYRGDHTFEDIERFARLEAAKVKRKDGETVGTHRIVNRETKTKVEHSANEGKAEIRYYAEGAPWKFPAKDWRTGFKSLAEARAALVDFAKNDTTQLNGPVEEIRIVGGTRRDTGAGLVSVKRYPVKTDLEIEVEVIKPSSYSNVPEGWIFFGLASS